MEALQNSAAKQNLYRGDRRTASCDQPRARPDTGPGPPQTDETGPLQLLQPTKAPLPSWVSSTLLLSVPPIDHCPNQPHQLLPPAQHHPSIHRTRTRSTIVALPACTAALLCFSQVVSSRPVRRSLAPPVQAKHPAPQTRPSADPISSPARRDSSHHLNSWPPGLKRHPLLFPTANTYTTNIHHTPPIATALLCILVLCSTTALLSDHSRLSLRRLASTSPPSSTLRPLT